MRKNKRGAALMFAIGLLTLVTLLASGVWGSIHMQTREAHGEARAATVRQLAEAGLEHARAAWYNGMLLPLGDELALGDGFYRLTATTEEEGRLRVISTGYLRDGPAVIERCALSTQLRRATP